MKGRNLYLTAIIMLVAGLVFIITANTLISTAIVIGGGIMFILAGLVNMLVFLGSRDRQGRARLGALGTTVGWLASAAAIVFGLCMLLFQGTFIPLVTFMFAILILFTAVHQICLLTFGSKPVRLSPWFFLVPVLLFGAAVFIYLQRPEQGHDHLIMYVTGGAFVLFGLASLAEGVLIFGENRRTRKAARQEALRPGSTSAVKDEAAE